MKSLEFQRGYSAGIEAGFKTGIREMLLRKGYLLDVDSTAIEKEIAERWRVFNDGADELPRY